MTYTHILKAHVLLNVQVSSKFLRPFGIKRYWRDKNQFLVLFLTNFKKKKVDLLQKVSNCERLTADLIKWFADSHVEGFEVSDGHSNSILVSEWSGALWCAPMNRHHQNVFQVILNIFQKIVKNVQKIF